MIFNRAKIFVQSVSVLPLLFSASTAFAELQLPKASPKAAVHQRIGVTDLSVSYSSPAVKGRTVWGELVPYGEVWRTGANECTKFSSSTEFEVAGTKIAAGEYCLVTIPGKDSWAVIFNSDAKQWGSYTYNEQKDVARVMVKPETAPLRERLGFTFDDVTDTSGNLRLHWERVAVEIPVTVPTKQQSLKNIKELSSSAWRDYVDAARYLLEEEKDPAQALTFAEKSIALEKTWFNHWIKAQVLEAKGDRVGALQYVTDAKRMGDDSTFFKAYLPQLNQALERLSKTR